MTNPGFSSSWGLIFDLGDEIPAETVQALNQAIWSRPEFEGPEQKMGQFQGSFRAAEGHLTLAAQSAKTYTKFEQDSIGYPPGWQVPLSLHISLYKMAPALPENPEQIILEKIQGTDGEPATDTPPAPEEPASIEGAIQNQGGAEPTQPQ